MTVIIIIIIIITTIIIISMKHSRFGSGSALEAQGLY